MNLEVIKQFYKDLEDILPSSDTENIPSDALALRGVMLYGRLGFRQEDPLPDFPMELNHPNFYYLYVGNAR